MNFKVQVIAKTHDQNVPSVKMPGRDVQPEFERY